MRMKRWLVLCFCLTALGALTACVDGKVQSTVSKAVSTLEDNASNAVSRVESGVDSMDGSSSEGSRLDSGLGSDVDSNPDSGLGSDVDSNPDEGLGSDVDSDVDSDLGNLDSDLADDGVAGDHDNSSAVDKDEEDRVSTKDR